jgi:hypothetical protein
MAILRDFIGGAPKGKSGRDWAERLSGWEKFEVEGECCFCGAPGEVYEVGCNPEAFGFGNFTDFWRRLRPRTQVCVGCLAVFKEYGLLNPGFLYLVEAGSRAVRDGEGEIAADNRRIFRPDAGGREAFLARLLEGLPEREFICGWKRPSTHALPFSPVNPAGCRVVQVLYQPADTALPAVLFFDRARHGGLVAEARRWWGGGGRGTLVEAHQGSVLLDFVLALTRPGRPAKGRKGAKGSND